jgi:uncharacterized membrane protein (DUF485 family)
MRKYLPLIRFALPWFLAGSIAAGVVLWLIIEGGLGKVGAITLTSVYIIAATAVAWIVAPLAPPVKP